MSQDRVRRLRQGLTEAERRLWAQLRGRRLVKAKFRRQRPVGPYIVDFCCPERMVVVEVDGGHHATQAEEDRTRAAFLAGKGFLVLRFWNNEVMGNMEGVLHRIAEAVGEPLTQPSPRRGEGAEGGA